MGYIGDYFGSYLSGTGVTILISLLALVAGFILGLVICIAKISNSKVLKVISGVYIEIVRGTPLLVQIMIIAYALPQVGVQFPSILGMGTEFTGGLVALVKQDDGSYARKGEVTADGAAPCYVAYDAKREFVYTSNYRLQPQPNEDNNLFPWL